MASQGLGEGPGSPRAPQMPSTTSAAAAWARSGEPVVDTPPTTEAPRVLGDAFEMASAVSPSSARAAGLQSPTPMDSARRSRGALTPIPESGGSLNAVSLDGAASSGEKRSPTAAQPRGRPEKAQRVDRRGLPTGPPVGLPFGDPTAVFGDSKSDSESEESGSAGSAEPAEPAAPAAPAAPARGPSAAVLKKLVVNFFNFFEPGGGPEQLCTSFEARQKLLPKLYTDPYTPVPSAQRRTMACMCPPVTALGRVGRQESVGLSYSRLSAKTDNRG